MDRVLGLSPFARLPRVYQIAAGMPISPQPATPMTPQLRSTAAVRLALGLALTAPVSAQEPAPDSPLGAPQTIVFKAVKIWKNSLP